MSSQTVLEMALTIRLEQTIKIERNSFYGLTSVVTINTGINTSVPLLTPLS